MKPNKSCRDPVMIGSSVHAYINDEPMKLSKTVCVFVNDNIVIETLNSIYEVSFTSPENKTFFIKCLKRSDVEVSYDSIQNK